MTSTTARMAEAASTARDTDRVAAEPSMLKGNSRAAADGVFMEPKPAVAPTLSPLDFLAYQRDVLERSILFFDTLRKRANAMLEHEHAGLPALLNFQSETFLDARQFTPPSNYALLRITQVGDKCWDECVDPGNPMRITAGLVGGVWLTHFLADLNQDRFDGAWLAQGFESLKPGNALWDKYANLFTRIDTEQQRFLDFERWWNGFYRLSGEEMMAIVENLFIGNRLEEGKVRVDAHCVADLTRIRSPIVIFASYGDNITPPHQALGWVPAVYKSTEALKAAGQRIIYLTNPHVGHLGIFVSAAVARLEHRAILEQLADIETLEPGLYEMKIDNPTGDPDCARRQYAVRFEPRRIEDLHFDYPTEAFERVRRISEWNESVYRTFVSPWVQAMATPWLSASMQWLHPMRTTRYLWSERFLPLMGAFAILADTVSKSRRPLPDGHPLMAQERKLIETVSAFWESARKLRDAAQERTFTGLYGR
jgi:Protein of unknown function (DUF3141)